MYIIIRVLTNARQDTGVDTFIVRGLSQGMKFFFFKCKTLARTNEHSKVKHCKENNNHHAKHLKTYEICFTV